MEEPVVLAGGVVQATQPDLQAIPAPRQPPERVGGTLRDPVFPEFAIVEMGRVAEVVCYPHPMPA
jgi:hypothetical protein